MSVGTVFNRTTIDNAAGDICAQMRRLFGNVALFQEWLQAIPDSELIALDYTGEEVATLKSTFGDVDGLGLLYRLYFGEVALPEPVNFSIGTTRLSGPS